MIIDNIEGGIDDTPDERKLSNINLEEELFQDFTYPRNAGYLSAEVDEDENEESIRLI